MYIYIFIYIHIYTCVCVCMYVNIYIRTYVCMYVYFKITFFLNPNQNSFTCQKWVTIHPLRNAGLNHLSCVCFVQWKV